MVLNKMEGAISGLYLEATHEDSDAGKHISYTEAKQLAEALRKLSRIAEDLRVTVKQRCRSLSSSPSILRSR